MDTKNKGDLRKYTIISYQASSLLAQSRNSHPANNFIRRRLTVAGEVTVSSDREEAASTSISAASLPGAVLSPPSSRSVIRLPDPADDAAGRAEGAFPTRTGAGRGSWASSESRDVSGGGVKNWTAIPSWRLKARVQILFFRFR